MEGSLPQCPLIHLFLSGGVVVKGLGRTDYPFSSFWAPKVVGRLPLFRLFFLSLSFYNDFYVVSQVVVEIQNLMRQHTHLFHPLEVMETMRAYVAHKVNGNEDLLSNLETMKNEAAAAQELVEEGVNLLRKRRLLQPRKRKLKKRLFG